MWTANLYKTTTGQIGPQLNFQDISWSVSLNKTEEFTISMQKSDLPNVDFNTWMAPWWAGVVLFWNGVPQIAGPILNRPNETFHNVDIFCNGVRSILAKRLVATELSDWSKLAKSSIQYKGLSLGTIAQRVVKQGQAKTAGGLPISYPIPSETAANDADHQRTYQGFNVQNINVDDVLTKLSGVVDGPDVMFRPRLLADNRLTLDMWHGTEKEPRIAQDHIPLWDTDPVRSSIVDMQVVLSGAYQTSRVYSLGAGTDEGLLIKVNTNTKPLGKGFPLLETTVNSGNSDNHSVVNSHGKATLAANSIMKQEIQMTVDGSDENNFIGSFWPGDLVKINTSGWLSLPNGIHEYRLLNINGNSSSRVRMSLQPESQYQQEIDLAEPTT